MQNGSKRFYKIKSFQEEKVQIPPLHFIISMNRSNDLTSIVIFKEFMKNGDDISLSADKSDCMVWVPP